MPTRRAVRIRAADGEEGFASLELVVVIPVLFAFVLLVVGFGRVTHGRQLVAQAAAAAARTAALDDSPGQARADALTEATDTLAQAGISCTTMHAEVDTTAFHPGGQVQVTISCVASLAGLGVVGFPAAKTLTATAAAPLETYRQLPAGASR